MSAKLFLLSALVALASAVPRPDSPPIYGAPPPTYKQPGMPFEFAYAVKDDYTGNDYAHQQHSDGHVTSGSYHVALPDGRTEIVEFNADHEGGYVAQVSYEGQASYPAPAPYHPPPPSYPAPTPVPYHPPPPTYPAPTPAPYHPPPPTYPAPTPAPYHPPPPPSYPAPTPAPYHPPPPPYYTA